MTDRANSLTVVFDRDIRVDDVQGVMAAIRMLRHVIDVRPNISDIATHVAETRARHELRTRIFEVLNDD